MFWDIFRHPFNFFDNLKFLAYFRQESASAIACLSRKPSPRKRQRALGHDADTKGFLGFGFKTKTHWICRVRRYYLVHHIEHPANFLILFFRTGLNS